MFSDFGQIKFRNKEGRLIGITNQFARRLIGTRDLHRWMFLCDTKYEFKMSTQGVTDVESNYYSQLIIV